MFYGAKAIIGDRDIDGEILINDSEIENPKVGQIYDCHITEFVKDKLIGQIICS